MCLLGSFSSPAHSSTLYSYLPWWGQLGGGVFWTPRQGSDHPSEGCGLSGSLAISRAGIADSKWPECVCGGGHSQGMILIKMQFISTSVFPVSQPLLPRAVCRSAGTGQDKAPRTRSPGETRRCLSGFWELAEVAGSRAGPDCLQRWGIGQHHAPQYPMHCLFCLTPTSLSF